MPAFLEKEHWKERISRKVEQAIETRQTEQDPGLMNRIRDEANEMARESLQTAELYCECEKIDVQIKRPYNGNRGQVENCVNNVALSYAASRFRSQNSSAQ